MTGASQLLPLEGGFNLRDMGGYATAEEAFAVWHARTTGEQNNIRDLKWDHVGIGVAGTGADRYWCVVYATKRN